MSEKKESEKDKVSCELRFVKHVEESRKTLRVGAAVADGVGQRVFYEWSPLECIWVYQPREKVEADALEFLKVACPGNAKATTAASCVNTLLTHMLCDHKRQLPRPAPGREVIATSDGYLVVHANGSLTIELPDPKWGVTYKVKTRLRGLQEKIGEHTLYRPRPVNSESHFARYLDAVLPDPDVQDVLAEAMGSTLVQRTFEKAIWLYGTGFNGKSTLIHILDAFHPNTSPFDLGSLSSNFGLQSIIGKSLLKITEAPSTTFDDAKFKQLVSQEAMMIDIKNKDPVNYEPRCKVFMAMNKMPVIRDKTEGFWRRVLPIPFDRSFMGSSDWKDSVHKPILESEDEMGQVLDFMLIGLVRLMQRTRFQLENELPQAIRTLFNKTRRDSDPVLAFKQDHNIGKGTRMVKKDDLYAQFTEYCHRSGVNPLSQANFWDAMKIHYKREHGVELKDCQPRIQGKRSRMVFLSFEDLPTLTTYNVSEELKADLEKEAEATNVIPFRPRPATATPIDVPLPPSSEQGRVEVQSTISDEVSTVPAKPVKKAPVVQPTKVEKGFPRGSLANDLEPWIRADLAPSKPMQVQVMEDWLLDEPEFPLPPPDDEGAPF